MSASIKSDSIADGISFTGIQDNRFKTNRLSVHFISRLSDDAVAENALLPQILKDGFEGCPDFTQLNRRLEKLYGARVETEVSKRGDSQILSLSVTGIDDRFLKNEQQTLSYDMAAILRDMILHPLLENGTFREKYTELEKAAQADTIDAEINEKRGYAIRQLIAAMCEKEPFGLPKYGTKDAVAAITPVIAKECYDKLLRSARIEIMFTGCGDPTPTEAVLREAFTAIEREYNSFSVSEPHTNESGSIKEKKECLPVNQCKMVLGFGCKGLSLTDERLPAMRLMIAVLGGTPQSKLFLNVREKLSLCYYCAARVDTYKGIVLVDCGVETENIEKARVEILAQLDEIKHGNVTEDELQTARLSLKNSYSTLGESDYAIESFTLGQLLTGQHSTPESEKVKLDLVTLQDVIATANLLYLDTVYLLTGREGE